MKLKAYAAAMALALSFSCSDREMKGPEAARQPEQAIEVEVAQATEHRIDRTIQIVGTLVADEITTISSEVEGVIAEILVDLGSFVRKGEVVAKIDKYDFELRLAEAEAALEQVRARLGIGAEQDSIDPSRTAIVRQAKASYDDAQRRLERTRQLRSKGAISQQELDEAETGFRIAQARYQSALEEVNSLLAQLKQRQTQVAMASRQLRKTVIRSPITGWVVERYVSAGYYVKDGNRVATLVKTNPLRLRADIPERYSAQVYVGRRLDFSVDILPGRSFQGRIARLSPAVNPETRSLTIEAEVDNHNNQLRPGYFARAQVVVEPDSKAIVIPAKAVVAYAGIVKVFVLENNLARERRIKIGAKIGDMVEVYQGVGAGELVIASNLDRIFDGARVRASLKRQENFSTSAYPAAR